MRAQLEKILPAAAAALILLPLAAFAQIDDVEARLREQFELALRWDNVRAGDAYWERGARPVLDRRTDLQAIHLAPGESITVRLPPTETLRLHPLNGSLREPSAALAVSLSNGTGLYAATQPRMSEDRRDLLVQASAAGPALARIVHSATASGAIDVALFVSRHEPLAQIAPYRELMRFPGPAVDLRPGSQGAGEQYWPLTPAVPIKVMVAKAGRYAVQSRLRYPANEAAIAQRWRIEVRLDDMPFRVLEFQGGAESTRPVLVDGVAAVVSREKEDYLDIPSGRHRIELIASASLLARVLRHSDSDYLFPRLNEPALSARNARAAVAAEERDVGASAPASLRRESTEAAAVLARTDASPGSTHAAAQSLIEDNYVRDGSVVAAAAMEQAAWRRRDYPAVRADAAETLGLNTVFRDLLPEKKILRGDLSLAYYLTPRLNGIGEAGRGVVAARQHESELLSWIDAGLFLPVPGRLNVRGARAQVQSYVLPERFAPTWLRVAAHGGKDAAGERLYLQFDDAAPTVLTVSAFPDLPGNRFAPSTGEIALQLQQEQHGEYGVGTLSGAFSRRFAPAPLIGVGYFDLPLPRAVQRIRLWREHADGPPLWVAVKYAAAQRWQLTEQAYAAATRAAGKDALPAFLAVLVDPERTSADPSQRELHSHWLPLARLIRAEAKTFAASIVPRPERAPAEISAAALIAEATKLAERGQWLAALERWQPVASSRIARETEQASWGQASALRELGEEFLAEQLLRQQVLHGSTAPIRARAREALAEVYRSVCDSESLQSVYATALARNGTEDSVDVVTGLVNALLDNDDPRGALTAGLLLSRAQRPIEPLLRAAYALQWWATFDDLLDDIRNPSRQNTWRGHRYLAQGHYDDAEAAFRHGDAEGVAFADHMQRGREIHRRLNAQPVATADTLDAWSTWLATHPGPRRWRDATFLVSDFAGAVTLYSIDRDAYLNVFRTSPGAPLRLRVRGPARLRLEARPLHATNTDDLIDGWLQIRSDAGFWPKPITQNPPASGLVLIGRPTERAGRRVTQDIDVGPGWHELEADGGDVPLLLRVEMEQPELLIGVLPHLTLATATMHAVGMNAQRARHWLGGCKGCSVLIGNGAEESARYVRPERNLIDSNSASLSDVHPPMRDAVRVSSHPGRDAERSSDASLRAAGRWRELLAMPTDQSNAARLDRVASLLWIAEHQPEHYAQALTLAQAIQAEHPAVAGMSALIERLARKSAWQPIEIVQKSAGLEAREIAGWEPEVPALRVRRALLAPTHENERVLTGAGQLVFSSVDPVPTQVQLTLTAEDVGALPPQRLVTRLEVNGEPVERVILEPGQQCRQRRVALRAGRNSVRLSIERPLADQFLRVRLSGTGGPQLIETTRRFYHVARKNEPVEVSLQGPAWLRIDEWVDDHTESRYQRIDAGWQHVTLEPADGRSQSLYRLHWRSIAPDQSRTSPRIISVAAEPVDPPPVQIPERTLADPARLIDRLPLGGQESGTWTFTGEWRQRLLNRDDVRAESQLGPALDDMGMVAPRLAAAVRGVALSSQREEFLELTTGHRYFAADSHAYRTFEGLIRLRREGGPTVGARTELRWSPAWTPLNFDFKGAFYTQDPGSGKHLDALRTEWLAADPVRFAGFDAAAGHEHRWERAGKLRASVSQRRDVTPKLWHEPRLETFWRHSSLDGNAACASRCSDGGYDAFRRWISVNFPADSSIGTTTALAFQRMWPRYRPGTLDQDIFTAYQSTHRRGLDVSDALTWQPRLDSQVYAGVGIVSGENYNLFRADHVSGEIGWRQLLGQARLHAYWNGNRYLVQGARLRPGLVHAVAVDFAWETWRSSRERLECGITLRREIDARATVFGIGTFLQFGNGRGYRDSHPREIDFLDIRERRVPRDENNEMQEDAP